MPKVDRWLYVIALFVLPIPSVYLMGKLAVSEILCGFCRDVPKETSALPALLWGVSLFALYCVCAAIWLKRKREAPFFACFYATMALLVMVNVEYRAFFGK